MDTKYTPGPWSINSDGEYCGARIDGPNGRSVAHAIQRDPHPTLGMGIAQDEAIANARQIAAAPELLEALQDMLHVMEQHEQLSGCDCSIGDAARAAIAKATGKEA